MVRRCYQCKLVLPDSDWRATDTAAADEEYETQLSTALNPVSSNLLYHTSTSRNKAGWITLDDDTELLSANSRVPHSLRLLSSRLSFLRDCARLCCMDNIMNIAQHWLYPPPPGSNNDNWVTMVPAQTIMNDAEGIFYFQLCNQKSSRCVYWLMLQSVDMW